MWRISLLPISAAIVLLLVGVIIDEKNWGAVSRWLKAIWKDIIDPNPLNPGPFTRFIGGVLGVSIKR